MGLVHKQPTLVSGSLPVWESGPESPAPDGFKPQAFPSGQVGKEGSSYPQERFPASSGASHGEYRGHQLDPLPFLVF